MLVKISGSSTRVSIHTLEWAVYFEDRYQWVVGRGGYRYDIDGDVMTEWDGWIETADGCINLRQVAHAHVQRLRGRGHCVRFTFLSGAFFDIARGETRIECEQELERLS